MREIERKIRTSRRGTENEGKRLGEPIEYFEVKLIGFHEREEERGIFLVNIKKVFPLFQEESMRQNSPKGISDHRMREGAKARRPLPGAFLILSVLPVVADLVDYTALGLYIAGRKIKGSYIEIRYELVGLNKINGYYKC